MSDLDESRCPECGHDVLSWDILCPGCKKVPGETDAARRVGARRQLLRSILGAIPVVGLAAAFALFWHLSRTADRGTPPKPPASLLKGLHNAPDNSR